MSDASIRRNPVDGTGDRSGAELPIDAVIPALRHALRVGTSAVLQAPPGAGKTTRVPLALMHEPWLGAQRILMLEPRRLATRAVATHMASLLGENVGETVGYRIRRDSRVGPRTRIEVVTEGILTRLLQRDPTLEGIGVVIFDEFHERSVHADLGLALTLQSRELVRPDLRIVVMSATLDGGAVARTIGDAPIVASEGRSYPVAVQYLDCATSRSASRTLEGTVVAHIERGLQRENGDILVFLPGGREIRRVARLLGERRGGLPDGVDVTPLYGDLPQRAQDAAIAAAPAGRRKVVLSTPIAETSLTIEGVTVVIDSGFMRAPRFSASSGMSRLETVRISRSSADQRCGRAGRVRPGVCYRLWPMHEQYHLGEHSTPEILQTDIAPLALDLAVAGITNPAELRWLDIPPAAAYGHARGLLTTLGALDAAGRVTAHGRAMAAFPTHPRIAHMLLTAKRLGFGALACDIAALLGERDILRGEGMPPDADIRLRLDVLQHLSTGGPQRDVPHAAVLDVGLARRTVTESAALRRQLGVEWTERGDDAAGVALALAYPDRVGRARADGESAGRFLLRNGRGAVLTHAQSLSVAEYVVAAHLDGGEREARIFLGAPLTELEVRTHFADQIEMVDTIEWDTEAAKVRAWRTERLDAIVLRESRIAQPDRAAVAMVLAKRIGNNGLSELTWSDGARSLRHRMEFARTGDAEWPEVSDEAITAQVRAWLEQQADSDNNNNNAIDSPADIDVHAILVGMLDWRQRAELERAAPTHYVTPAGSRIAIDYSDPSAPAIAVRLQEMFGAQSTPTVAGGQVPLTVQLLSPARRPVQVTRDLAGFWRGSYFEVRKELRGRYPKHSWPDDPLAAPPTSRAKRRGE